MTRSQALKNELCLVFAPLLSIEQIFSIINATKNIPCEAFPSVYTYKHMHNCCIYRSFRLSNGAGMQWILHYSSDAMVVDWC